MHQFVHKYRAAFYAVIALAVLGMLATAYLTYQHYKFSGQSFCNINNYVSCDIVNKSKYSEIFGVPVSILGFVAYSIFFIATLGLLKNWSFEKIGGALTAFTGFSFLFSIYLTYIEFFVLQAICVFCVTQQIIILIIFIILLTLWLKHRKLSRSG